MSQIDTLREIITSFESAYRSTPTKLKLLDAFSVCALLTAVLQFVYAKLVGTFPFNSFLAGFFCCVGTFVLTVSLRMKVSEGGSGSGPREFGGYALAMLTLFIAAWNYVG
ncbi:Dolichyl-diphosphooligosaccharide-- glycosyltransferase subunit DAD1 [Chlorella sorokiniana]|uniref:Dolichyl-diphosphooligosaccharide--protein glycosyltransferase subunit DAD1 n=1 Tax=Chlorella sorokiniana TaxID=3076 RepID=A0A2P6TYA0_CHLSO|nr:Dolichyl-diphosphooligosaccharide-- glycosyltransferase subunit DAD1 [Chlorella sorokiniana]|eukprot:PRW59033.1 Dolichyl-diphosphooligosaccharide-- glycosyltransferase subunit DAD1 [Chlorella sorokiniana]